MKRHNGSGKFRQEGWEGEDVNPMDGVANLADVMLVFACGLMLALITYWNVDVAGIQGKASQVTQGQEVTDEAGLSQQDGAPADGTDLQQYGMVYRDSATGKLYLVPDHD